MERETRRAYKPQSPADFVKGDAAQGWQTSATRLDALYITPVQTHNAMEPHATIAVWEGDNLTLYDATQGVFSDRSRVAGLFEIEPDNVRVISNSSEADSAAKGRSGRMSCWRRWRRGSFIVRSSWFWSGRRCLARSDFAARRDKS